MLHSLKAYRRRVQSHWMRVLNKYYNVLSEINEPLVEREGILRQKLKDSFLIKKTHTDGILYAREVCESTALTCLKVVFCCFAFVDTNKYNSISRRFKGFSTSQ